MAALSPLDLNANLRSRPAGTDRYKQKAPATLAPATTQQPAKAAPPKVSREKDHPPPPPAEVCEPPSSDRPNGAIYKMGGLLGKGGFAICHEAVLAGTRQKYALKIVKSVMPQKKMEQKFQTELQIHSKMKQANIVNFHRAFTFQQSTYIVLELCPNGSLMDMVKKRKFVTEPEVRFYTVQIAGAIKYMHYKGIIHRDLKMGNIFLDKDMNVKIGDFGLAALLMSGKDYQKCRRTTLCGTPNYIAPEILEKGKKGHDHAVDIWSLGIIIFAMLTGRPPFQSTTQEEIYRKAREREYDWPTLDKVDNYICQEAKDLVATLLQSPEDRPDCDTIVQHPFFSCGAVPLTEEMSPKLCVSPPSQGQFSTPGLRGSKSKVYAKNLKTLCMKCDVGPWSRPQKLMSTYAEVAAEEEAGLTPAVPLPDNVVYRPYDEILQESGSLQRARKELSHIAEEDSQSSTSTVRPPTIRGAPQSFAAQQRAQNLPSSMTATARRPRAQQESAPVSRSSREQPIDLTRSRADHKPESNVVSSRALGKQRAEPESNLRAEARIGADLAKQLHSTRIDPKSSRTALPVKATSLSIFSPHENLWVVPNTKPRHVMRNLQAFYAEVERALNSRSTGPAREQPLGEPPLVVKWVDYTNKFGLGYILNDGTVGCIFKSLPCGGDSSKGFIPPSCIVVRDAERHLQHRNNPNYPDRHQLVPISGQDIEFYENKADEGIVLHKVNPQNYVVAPEHGSTGRLSRGRDEWDDRKREKIVLWKKFANYMTAYGRDQDCPEDQTMQRHQLGQDGDMVMFYQRFGDVGCWVFSSGAFQFNFPDHTKILISADGTWCDFYHLPLEAARDLAETGTLSSSALDERQQLSYPLQTLLNFMAKPSSRAGTSTRRRGWEIDPMLQGIPAANDFRRKIEFVKAIVGEWIENGGIGKSSMEPETRLRWVGHREQVNVKMPYKHVWVTVGAYGGDDRRVAWFDPRNPAAIVPDIEN